MGYGGNPATAEQQIAITTPVQMYAWDDVNNIPIRVNATNLIIITGGLVPSGIWSNSTQYAIGDLVYYNGVSYLAFAVPPLADLPTDTTYWQPFVSSNTPANGYLIFGDGITDGSWQIIVSGTTLSVQRLESGLWVEKGLFTA